MTSCKNEVTTMAPDYLTIYEASYSGDKKLLEKLMSTTLREVVVERVNYPDHEWGDRTALHLAASKGIYYRSFYKNILCMFLLCLSQFSLAPVV